MKILKSKLGSLIVFYFGVVCILITLFMSYLVYKDILGSKNDYLHNTEIKVLNNELDRLFKDIVYLPLITESNEARTLIVDKISQVNTKMDRLLSLVENEIPLNSIIQEIQDNWFELSNVDNPQKLNILYNLELIHNSLDSQINKRIGLRQDATVKNTNILVQTGLLFGTLSLLFMFVYKRAALNSINEIGFELQKTKDSHQTMATFLSTAGHEIRTPLNGIIGLSDVLRKSNLPNEESNYADNIFHSGKALLKIFNNILEYTKIESGVVDLEFSEFPVGAVIQQIINTFSLQAKEKNIKFTYIIDENIPLIIYGDQSRLSQVLFNFISNAVNYTLSGTINIRVKVISKDPKGQLMLYFSVEDTGIGLSEEQIKKLYTPLNQLQVSSKIGETHPGLGFARCNQLVKAMGGEIEVSSKLGIGSMFSFTAVFSKYSEEVLGADYMKTYHYFDEHKMITPIFDRDDRPSILVADDNPANLLMIKTVLERLGAKVLTATNGREVVSAYAKDKVNLILLDCQMPVMDGYEAAKVLRNNKVNIPILAMTATSTPEELAKCLSVGMNGLLSKPIELEKLKSELVRTLQLDPCEICSEAIDRLEAKIGHSGMSTTVQKFLDELPLCNETLSQCLVDNNIDEIHKIGNHLKSSSQIVGAKGLAHLFKRLEDEKNKDELEKIKNEILNASTRIRNKLDEYVVHLH